MLLKKKIPVEALIGICRIETCVMWDKPHRLHDARQHMCSAVVVELMKVSFVFYVSFVRKVASVVFPCLLEDIVIGIYMWDVLKNQLMEIGRCDKSCGG